MQIYKDTLVGKVAFVTGAGSGIGRATAKLLAFAGARVAPLTRNREDSDSICAEIRHGGGEVLPVIGDVSKPSEIDAAVAAIHSTWQKLDIVVANAGINGLWAPIDEISVEEWTKTMTVNLTGTFVTLKPSLPLLKVSGGSVIIVSSVNGTRIFSNPGTAAYAVSKAGQAAFAKKAAIELAQHRIRVNVICPGSISTRIDDSVTHKDLDHIKIDASYPKGTVPLTEGQPGTAGQVAQLIWFLASDASSHITGTEVFIDGGESLLMG
ncbi:3-oxoacyl-[acyl-carrier-protein] reductase [Nibricoccus aquaticus]|uniref:3-oxoacyl-[acyl-carrier-protein] reductase n=1 Tax=Nibricoccus aquaticus TaxID=2576891 RepID=A0A290Q9Q1_9BACT|nr:SDR family NAD(P)-dependent oxidoreductase [Nibricoccus aquaticus]ATC62956.1 3-oxoacyl-[acyl-carrier-protein] reductase [Nibricoccus aquaticus]